MTQLKIHKNVARCKKCNSIIESKSVHDYRSCSCGACAVDGGHEYVRRTANSFDDMEDLTEYLITWKDVLDCKIWLGTIDKMYELTKTTGYKCFMWNDVIYLISEKDFIRTGKFRTDLSETAPPCIIKSLEVFV